jgi:intein/homing endonuclease
MMNLENVSIVEMNSPLTDFQEHKIVRVVVQIMPEQKVYDLMVENNHEYFANGDTCT